MRIPIITATGLAATALIVAAPAGAQTTSYYLGCTNDMKYQNDQAHTWTTTKPAASVQSGAGCGTLDLSVLGSAAGHRFDFITRGVHAGTLQSINVEIYSLLLSQARALPDFPGTWSLVVDGEEVHADTTTRIAGEIGNSGTTEKFTFSFSRKRPAGATVTPPLVTGAGPHDIEIRFSSRTVEYQNLWTWGTSEVPANVTVNPTSLASPKLIA